jgi:hypothetical protein
MGRAAVINKRKLYEGPPDVNTYRDIAVIIYLNPVNELSTCPSPCEHIFDRTF